jgi:polar amino acid transport system substrate-binding protein
MKYFLTVVIGGLLNILVLFSRPVYGEGNMSPDIQAIIDRGKLVVAMYHKDSPPFYYVDKKGNLSGVDVELIEGFGRLLGVGVEFVRTPSSFDAVVDMIANKEADLAICKLSITFLRAGRVLFTHPYIELHQGLLINRLLLAKQLRGRVKEEALRSLTGKVGVIANSSYVGYAKRNFGDMEMVEFPSWKRVVQAVTSGEIIAGYRDEAEIKKIIRDEPNSAVKLLTATLLDAKDPKGIAVSADSTHLRELLEFYLKSLNLNLTADKVLYEYTSVISTIRRNTL